MVGSVFVLPAGKLFLMNYNEYKDCIDACNECVAICNHCLSSCLQEEDVSKMAECIRLDYECVIVCRAAADLMSTGSKYVPPMCQLCAEVCNACAEECGKHDNDHCRQCAETCKRCAEMCMDMVTSI